MISLVHLTKEYEIDGRKFRALDDVSLTVESGEIYGIIGLSGAGKSTLIRTINRLETADEGEIIVDGEHLNRLDDHALNQKRREIAMVFQSFNLFEQMNCYDNIAYPLRLYKFNEKEIRSRVDELLEFIGLTEKKKAYPAQLSGGQKQRIAIARAMANKPKILLSDEATSALDPTSTRQVLDLYRRINTLYGMTIILITHQMEVAKEICHRIGVMEHGRIVEENVTTEIFKNPKHPTTLSFIEKLREDGGENLNPEEFEGTLVRLIYRENVNDPIVSYCICHYGVTINIISGHINHIQGQSVGYLMTEIQGAADGIEKTLAYMRGRGVGTEVLS